MRMACDGHTAARNTSQRVTETLLLLWSSSIYQSEEAPMPDLHAPNFSNYSTRPKGCATSVTTSPVSLNVVYCISCCCCHYLYIGETRRQLKMHFSWHLRSIQNWSDWQTACLWFCNCNIIVICFLLCQLRLAKKLLRASYLFFFRTK